MMQRYDVGEYDSGMVPHSDGDWVKYEDVEKLEKLNREMVEVLEDVLYYELAPDVYTTIKEFLAKAERMNE